jgi:hypothetical protein
VQQAGAPPFAGADADFRVWRRIDPALFPPILREVFVAPKASAVLTDPELQAVALPLAQRLLDAKPQSVTAALPPRGPMLILGLEHSVDAWLLAQGLPARPFRMRGSAQVWAGRDVNARPYVVVSARDAAALKALERGLPHNGKQSWLVLDGARVAEKGAAAPH